MNNSLLKAMERGRHPIKIERWLMEWKKSLMRMFPTHLHREVKEEFASFAAGLDDYSAISSLDDKSTMSLVRWWICHGENGVHLQTLAICILSQVASSSSIERNWSTYGFIHSVKHNRLGSRKLRILFMCMPIFALHLVGVWNITMGLLKNGMWIQNLDLDISLTALNIEEPNSLVGHSYSTLQFTIGCASCSIF